MYVYTCIVQTDMYILYKQIHPYLVRDTNTEERVWGEEQLE